MSYFFHKIKNQFAKAKEINTIYLYYYVQMHLLHLTNEDEAVYFVYMPFSPLKEKNNLFDSFNIECLSILEIAEKKNTKKKVE